MRALASTIAVAAIALVLAMPTAFAATANRTWVSHAGMPGNTAASPPCNPQMPCDTFANALSVTNPGGEINCVDNGSYGVVNITQSVTIDCGGQLGTIDASGSANAITVNGSNIVVKLRNLTINGNGSTGPGVAAISPATVIIENCVVQNFGLNGIAVGPNGSLQLNMSDTLIAASAGAGIIFFPSGSGTVGFVLERVRVEGNATGVSVDGHLSSGVIKGFVRDSLITGSTTGIGIDTGTALAVVSVYRSHIIDNTFGVVASDGTVGILSNSTIQANGTALSSSSGAAIYSYGNNDINDNGAFGSAPIVISQH